MDELTEQILESFKKNGMSITNQRKLIISLVLKNQGISGKEIFYQAHNEDDSISLATVYRTLNSLEELGFLERKYVLKNHSN